MYICYRYEVRGDGKNERQKSHFSKVFTVKKSVLSSISQTLSSCYLDSLYLNQIQKTVLDRSRTFK